MRLFDGTRCSKNSVGGRVPRLGGSGARRGCSPKPSRRSGESTSSPAVNLKILLDFFGGCGDVGDDTPTGDETLILLPLLNTWCLLGEAGLRESLRCKEAGLSDTVLVVLVSDPASVAFLLFASSRAATSALDNCTGGGANIFVDGLL